MYPDAFVLEDAVMVLLTVLTATIPSSLISIAAYVLSSIALYSLATRRRIQHAWLSWVPVLNVWVIGSLSDQYRYVVKGQYKSKRKILLLLNLLTLLTGLIMAVVGICMGARLVSGFAYGIYVEETVLTAVLTIALLALPLAGLIIAAAVVRFMALYDVYQSMDPNNSVLFLVLSILFRVTEAFFLFFNRQKDDGMPPRRPEPQWAPPASENNPY